MRIDIGDGVRLFVDVDGVSLAPVEGKLVKRPTLILLHGGPGLDHATYKLGLVGLRDVAQVVMYDHRGHGRSDRCTPDSWTLDTWADDVVRLCDALGIEKPIVLGNSFGGFVAQRYLGRHPEHPAKVVLSSTAARWTLDPVLAVFEQLGGAEARDVAHRFWTDPSKANRADYLRICGPLYTQSPGNHFDSIETIRNDELFAHWNDGGHRTFDCRGDLARATCPALVLGGEQDPVCPIAASEEIAAHLPPHLVQFERFDRCGHGVFRDNPERAYAVLRNFITTT